MVCYRHFRRLLVDSPYVLFALLRMRTGLPSLLLLRYSIPILFISTLKRNGKDENLIGNTFGCKRLEILNSQFAQAAAESLNPVLAPLDKKISKYVGGNPIRIVNLFAFFPFTLFYSYPRRTGSLGRRVFLIRYVTR